MHYDMAVQKENTASGNHVVIQIVSELHIEVPKGAFVESKLLSDASLNLSKQVISLYCRKHCLD